ncbi:hypothetical protein [Erythrobacter sp. F6033]|uniref:hypothetical protein n=1 Tax=Erythrobacter sp. F6033 TaxID=2926401 RepID=UPI001FF5CFFC|nr:hypothetical protein [Erythrobacter sp. F6033]MCK0129445.1 hypothetical protein [Erythrobacter sp. F6033]
MISKQSGTWQIILADLALILFLSTLLAVPGLSDSEEDETPSEPLEFAPSQALYRPDPDGPGLSEWLDQQVQDPRATLTIHARYRDGESERVWQQAQSLAVDATEQGWTVRLVISQDASSDIYASIGYDAPVAGEPDSDQS